jgi:hypothetical protein
MEETIALEAVLESTESVRRVVRRHEKEDVGERSWERLLRRLLAEGAELRSLWPGALELLRRGLEGGNARDLLQLAVRAMSAWLDTAEALRTALQEAERRGGQVSPDLLAETERATQGIRPSLSEAEALLRRFNTAAPEVAPEVLDGLGEAFDRGECLDADTFIARLRAGSKP